MSEGNGAVPAADERISFRGPVQRLLISPEIGALIGTVMVWALFWSTGQKFGEAASTASWLDGAAPLGIMAVAIALLMIGGEFDLSAGVMTGSTGIMVGLFAQKFLGDGVTMWLAVPVAFLAAGVIGWFNGTLVNKTGLPSFIVTLATFFILRGVNLVFSKRLVDKVLVENIDGDTVKDFEVFRQIFASVHNKTPFSGRDALFLALVLIGAVLLVSAMLEMSLVRRAARNTKALPVALIGVIVAAAGLFLAHNTDGIGANLAACVIGFGGSLVAVLGYASFRYETAAPSGSWMVRPAVTPLAIGLGSVGIAWLVTRFLDADEQRVLLSVPPHAVKVLIGLVAFGVGAAVVAQRGISHIRSSVGGESRSALAYPRVAVTSLIGGLLALVGVTSFLQLCTEQGFRALVLVGLSGFGLVMLLVAKGAATKHSRNGGLLVGAIAATTIVLVAFVLRGDSGAVRFRAGLFTALLIAATLVLGNALVERHHVKRRAADRAGDRAGRLHGAVGIGLMLVAMAMRLFFSGANVRVSILWWIIATAAGAFVLARTKWGNWIFAVGGNKDAARAVGVPADQVKVGLFVMTSLVGCFVGMLTALRFTSVAASGGVGEEFEYIIAAVVGGCLLTGGYGSVIGASLGAMISAMTLNGIPAARWNSDNRYIFLGAVLFIAVLVNQKIRKKAQEAR